MPKGYCVGHITIDDLETYEEYKSKVPASVAAGGGTYLVRGGAVDVVEGAFEHMRTVVLEFESVDAAKAWYHSAQYGPIRAIRQAASRGDMQIVEGV